uniref:Cytochrome c oxidase subunit 3 n=4 Tax=Hepatozoon TaxID=75741 RepID=A0A8F5LQP9_9APIC|nr:cytochrome c oxidase subunit III [Hepatozoon catesbianae]AIG55090.1 cytochrome c oxidase subunit III [Hepatozoon catesbianae]QXN53142.1 cytochrome c oxidase subunit III [Hepatozoon sp.]
MCSSLAINQVKAHLQTYPFLSVLFGTTLRYFSVGILLSCNFIFFLLFLYSLRESYFSTFSAISSCCLGIILTEALLFAGYFWGAFQLSWSSMTEAAIPASSRSLILTITLLLSSASIVCSYLLTIRDKSIYGGASFVVLTIVAIGITFSSLQTTEFMMIHYSINDSLQCCLFFTLTGLHFSHVFVGVVLLLARIGTYTLIYQDNNSNTLPFGQAYSIPTQHDNYSLVYWHFVELVWLVLQFVFYTE